MSTATTWAVLLTKWNDKSPESRSLFEQLFTTAGTGTFNVTDYFDKTAESTSVALLSVAFLTEGEIIGRMPACSTCPQG